MADLYSVTLRTGTREVSFDLLVNGGDLQHASLARVFVNGNEVTDEFSDWKMPDLGKVQSLWDQLIASSLGNHWAKKHQPPQPAPTTAGPLPSSAPPTPAQVPTVEKTAQAQKSADEAPSGAGPTSSSSPNTLPKWYSAQKHDYIAVGSEFEQILGQYSTSEQGRAALQGAKGWIDKVSDSKQTANAKTFQDFYDEYLSADQETIKNTADQVKKDLVDYNEFRQLWVGQPITAELSAFLTAAEIGVESKVQYQNALKFRANALQMLINRQAVIEDNPLGGISKPDDMTTGGSGNVTSKDMQQQLKSFAPIFGYALGMPANLSAGGAKSDSSSNGKKTPPTNLPADSAQFVDPGGDLNKQEFSTYEPAIKVVLKHEGGWVDNPADPGGETNFGISMLIIRREKITLEDLKIPNWNKGCLKLMTVDTAKKLYKSLFWDRYGYWRLSDERVATKVFDASVNIGPRNAHRLATKVAMNLGAEIEATPKFTATAVKCINKLDPDEFLKGMVQQMNTYYTALTVARPPLKEFLNNWLKRAAWCGWGSW